MNANQLALSELVARLRWFIVLRWIAVAGIVGIAAALRFLVDVQLPAEAILIVAAAVAIYNLFFSFWWKRQVGQGIGAREATLSANAQIALDLFFLTILLHFVGGVENPFFLYYVFHIIIASILLSASTTYLQATLALLLFGGLVTLEFFGLIPHVAIGALGRSGAYQSAGYVIAVMAAFGSTLYLAAYMAGSIVGRLRKRENEVLALKDRLQVEQERLQEAYRRLQETEEAKSRYMRKVGHQLRAPLAAVQMLLSAIGEGLGEQPEEVTMQLLERARNRTREMLDLVGDLLALSRAREVGPVAVTQPVSLSAVAERVIALFAGEASAKGVKLETALPGTLPIIQGDPTGLEDLLANLVSNAIKYTPARGVVSLTLANGDGRVMIEVADTGIGIAPEELSHIFEEFYRGERARALAREGTGLGLAIVRAVVDAHGGTIAIESAAGKGTTFTVTLPAPLAQNEAGSSLSDHGPIHSVGGNQENQTLRRHRGVSASFLNFVT